MVQYRKGDAVVINKRMEFLGNLFPAKTSGIVLSVGIDRLGFEVLDLEYVKGQEKIRMGLIHAQNVERLTAQHFIDILKSFGEVA